MRSTLGPSLWKRPRRSLLVTEKSDSHSEDFSYERPAKPGSMDPDVAFEMVTAAEEIGPLGTGCGFAASFGKAEEAVDVIAVAAQPDRTVAAESAAAPPRNRRRDSRKGRLRVRESLMRLLEPDSTAELQYSLVT